MYRVRHLSIDAVIATPRSAAGRHRQFIAAVVVIFENKEKDYNGDNNYPPVIPKKFEHKYALTFGL